MTQFVEVAATKRSIARRKAILGVGINDAEYLAEIKINGIRRVCPYYVRWKDMLKRCYSQKSLHEKPTYYDCAVCDDWLTFSNFKTWMKNQDWVGKHLDKDIKNKGNKVYCPDSCLFVDQHINKLLLTSKQSRGQHPLGVCWSIRRGRFVSSLSIEGRNVFLGYFDSSEEAHEKYKIAKYKEIARIANLEAEPLKTYLLDYEI